MQANPSGKRWKFGQHVSSNVIVYSLFVIAVVLGSLATWQRFAQRDPTDLVDTAEQRFGPAMARSGVPENWVPVAGRRQGAAATARCRFVCRQCQASCWMNAPGSRLGSPGCPFCGVSMSRQGLDPQGGTFSPVGGMPPAPGAMGPIAIPPGAVCPHNDRGACSHCHTVTPTATGGITPVAAVHGTLWRGVAAPAIPANATAPTLIEEIGMEIVGVQGAGARVTGIMGNSFAAKAGMKTGDIIIKFNGTKVRNAEQFNQLIAKAPPEAEAQIVVLRSGRTKDLLVMVDEGEMDGFTPIQRP